MKSSGDAAVGIAGQGFGVSLVFRSIGCHLWGWGQPPRTCRSIASAWGAESKLGRCVLARLDARLSRVPAVSCGSADRLPRGSYFQQTANEQRRNTATTLVQALWPGRPWKACALGCCCCERRLRHATHVARHARRAWRRLRPLVARAGCHRLGANPRHRRHRLGPAGFGTGCERGQRAGERQIALSHGHRQGMVFRRQRPRPASSSPASGWRGVCRGARRAGTAPMRPPRRPARAGASGQ